MTLTAAARWGDGRGASSISVGSDSGAKDGTGRKHGVQVTELRESSREGTGQ